MTIASIHILEAVVVLLVCIKLLKIWSLYKASSQAARPQVSSRTKVKPKQKQSSVRPHKLNMLNSEREDNLFLDHLPMPEVLFSSDHEEVVLTETAIVPEKKSILNSYIDDFFHTSPQAFEAQKEVRELKFSKEKSSHSHDDEFITVQEENAELVRAMQALSREVGISARG